MSNGVNVSSVRYPSRRSASTAASIDSAVVNSPRTRPGLPCAGGIAVLIVCSSWRTSTDPRDLAAPQQLEAQSLYLAYRHHRHPAQECYEEEAEQSDTAEQQTQIHPCLRIE